jgi:very-long-chain enoyl-CoA reductase
MWTVHFTKRLLESQFLHIYSLRGAKVVMHGCFTSAAFVFYIFFAFTIGASVSHSSYSDESFGPNTKLYMGLFFLSVLLNFIHHYKLRLLKVGADATGKRTFPNGLGFEYVACPHYTAEVLTWFLWAAISNTFFSWCFFIATTALLLRWSKQRFLRYTEMEGFPKHRTALIPYLY